VATKPALEASIRMPWTFFRRLAFGSFRASHRFMTPVTVFTPKRVAVAIATAVWASFVPCE